MSFNYFLTFRLNDQNLQKELRKVHVEFVGQDESIKNFIEPVEKAHVTLNVINCEKSRLEELKQLKNSREGRCVTKMFWGPFLVDRMMGG